MTEGAGGSVSHPTASPPGEGAGLVRPPVRTASSDGPHRPELDLGRRHLAVGQGTQPIVAMAGADTRGDGADRDSHIGMPSSTTTPHPAADKPRKAPHRHFLLHELAIMQGLRRRPTTPAESTGFQAFRSRCSRPDPRRGARATSLDVAASPPTSLGRIATTIERGGFGAEAAAPATRRILAAYFVIKAIGDREPGVHPTDDPAPPTFRDRRAALSDRATAAAAGPAVLLLRGSG